MSDEGQRRPYAPAAAIVVAVALALAVMPSALLAPQTNPSATLEYAPVPGSSDRTPRGGDVASLGLAGGSGLGGMMEDVEAPRDGGAARGAGKSPRTKRCVGRPPRQTEDRLSPPCVAHFDGDNGGEVHRGVTDDEVRIVVYVTGENTGFIGSRPWEGHAGGDVEDLGAPAKESDHFWVRNLRVFQRYFNDRYQTYGRFVRFYASFSQYGTPEARRADAARDFAQIKPFAVVSYIVGEHEDVYLQEMAARGVLNFGSARPRSAAFFEQYPSMLWGYLPPVETEARSFARFVCTKVLRQAVSFSGNSAETGRPRRLGLLTTTGAGLPAYRQFGDMVRQQVEACGGRFAAHRTYDAYNVMFGRPESSVKATENVAAMRDAGVTTVLFAKGYETEHSKAAGRAGWRPEWVVAGDQGFDGQALSSAQDQTVWRHAWLVSPVTLDPPVSESTCFHAMREAAPDYPREDAVWACSVNVYMYYNLRQLFTGIQVAGPRLTPTSIDTGFHAIPAVASSHPSVPACFYEARDYTCVKDAASMWWDPDSSVPEGYGPGCWRAVDAGRRYIGGAWPPGDVASHRNRSEDPCNSHSGGAYTTDLGR